MTRDFKVDSSDRLDLLINGEVIATLPFPSHSLAWEFGEEFVARDAERQAAMARHPAGKRRLTEPAAN